MNKKIGYLAGLGVIFLYGANPVLTKFFLEEHGIDTLVTNFLRLFLGGIIIFFIARILLRRMRDQGQGTEKFVYNKKFFIALGGYILYHVFSYTALRYTTATNVELINAFTPVGLVIISLFLAPAIIARFKSNARLVFVIILLGSIGSSLILDIGFITNDFSSLKALGDGLAFIAMFGYAFFSLKISEYKENKNLLSVQVLYRLLLITAAAFFPIALVSGFESLFALSFGDMIKLGVFLVVSGGFSTFLWMSAARNLNVLTFILLHNFTPFVTIGLEMYLLGFQPGWQIFIGGILVISASTSIEFLTTKNDKKATHS